MKKTTNRLFVFFSNLLLLLLPLVTIINCILCYLNFNGFLNSDTIYLNSININFCSIQILLIEYACSFWKFIALVLLVVTISVYIVLPILSYIKKAKSLYIIHFVIILLDFFLSFILPSNYVVLLLNIIYHIILLLILGVYIKGADELE